MFDIVKNYCNLTGTENVYDLYTGLGSIALYVAQYCKQITGIEEIAAAIDDARINAELNNITNAVFYAGDVKDILDDKFSQKHGKPDVVITDPPRIGMHADVVDTLLKLEAPKIVYVSCNPATQARDIQLLSEKYKVTRVRPVDMFPHTYHIESVALLELLRTEN
jgi:23S rRNA (uracil1939-C5)-methyltransferase